MFIEQFTLYLCLFIAASSILRDVGTVLIGTPPIYWM